MRILVAGLGRIDQAPGGSARYMSGLTQALRCAGHDVLELTGADLFSAAGTDQTGFSRQIGRSLMRATIGVPRGALAVARFRPDVVTVHFALDGVGVALGARWSHRPLVAHFHGPWAREAVATGQRGGWPLSTSLRHQLERSLYARADMAVALSDPFASLLSADYAVPAERIRTIPGGIDMATVPPIGQLDASASRRALGVTDRLTLVTVRRLVPRTGVDLAIEALAQLNSGNPGLDVQLLVAGDGPELPRLRAHAESLGVGDRTVFIGRFPDELLWAVHGSGDVCLVPSRSLEGFGYGALEGIAAGRPTIVTDIGGLPGLIGPLEPRWVVPATADDVAAAVARVIGDRAAYPSAAALRSYAEQFDWQDIAARVVDVYREALSGRSHAASQDRGIHGQG